MVDLNLKPSGPKSASITTKPPPPFRWSRERFISSKLNALWVTVWATTSSCVNHISWSLNRNSGPTVTAQYMNMQILDHTHTHHTFRSQRMSHRSYIYLKAHACVIIVLRNVILRLLLKKGCTWRCLRWRKKKTRLWRYHRQYCRNTHTNHLYSEAHLLNGTHAPPFSAHAFPSFRARQSMFAVGTLAAVDGIVTTDTLATRNPLQRETLLTHGVVTEQTSLPSLKHLQTTTIDHLNHYCLTFL